MSTLSERPMSREARHFEALKPPLHLPSLPEGEGRNFFPGRIYGISSVHKFKDPCALSTIFRYSLLKISIAPVLFSSSGAILTCVHFFIYSSWSSVFTGWTQLDHGSRDLVLSRY